MLIQRASTGLRPGVRPSARKETEELRNEIAMRSDQLAGQLGHLKALDDLARMRDRRLSLPVYSEDFACTPGRAKVETLRCPADRLDGQLIAHHPLPIHQHPGGRGHSCPLPTRLYPDC
jgi:hypothetical protein